MYLGLAMVLAGVALLWGTVSPFIVAGVFMVIVDEPRSIVQQLAKDRFEELPRHKDEGFCCGGGGGRIWMEEHHKRINHLRLDEAIGLRPTR